MVSLKGFELFCDFLLADYICHLQPGFKIVFCIKKYPWFVSDTTMNDIDFLLSKCLDSLDNVVDTSIFQVTVDRWKHWLNEGKWQISSHKYWTLPNNHWDLAPSSDLFPNLSESLFMEPSNRLVFFKGDLNYRKLINDFNWDARTSFNEALGPLTSSSVPFVALRTCKSDPICGLAGNKEFELASKDSQWRFNGKYGKFTTGS